MDNLQNLLRVSKPIHVDVSRSLFLYERYFQSIASSSSLFQLLDIDPDAVVAKVRRIGEHIAKLIVRRSTENPDPDWSFAAVTRKLYDQRIISAKAKGYIDTIRVLGNIASHASDFGQVKFSREDALVVLQALLLFIQEAKEINLL